MVKKKDKYSFDEIQRLGAEKREAYTLTLQDIYPDKIVKINGEEINVGKICRKWYQTIYDYAPNPRDEMLEGLVLFIDVAYKNGDNLNDHTTLAGRRWDFLMKYHYKLGKNYRITMDSTNNEMTRLLTRK